MTITSCCEGAWLLPAGGSVVTTSVLMICCDVDCSELFDCAKRRRRCTEANTSACWVAKAYPSCRSHGRLPFMVASTAGNGTSDFTLASHGSFSTALASASPERDLCAESSTHRAAETTSSGKVEAISVWV